MKVIRHCAAAALVGWYLVPPSDLAKGVVDDAAPLSRLTIEDSFSSAPLLKETIHERRPHGLY